MQPFKHILVIRFSAMGDVAMTVPVIKNVLQQHPDVRITVVSNAFFAPLFEGIERCTFYPAYLKKEHRGVAGLYRLFRTLVKMQRWEVVIDLHQVLRSILLRIFFFCSGNKMVALDKGRKEKDALTRKENKKLGPLVTTHERYAQVFRDAGIPVILYPELPVLEKQPLPEWISTLSLQSTSWIGVAPFAQHDEKMYPLEKMKEVIAAVATQRTPVLLFGGGKEEAAILSIWEKEQAHVYSIAGKISFREELAIISHLRIMISMDSANMHLASLYQVPVISIWGATHPYAGFYGWGQPASYAVQADLYCRPCSVFGNKPCFRGDHACMQLITKEMIVQQINALL